jgi:hypothetical protein
MAVIQPFTVIAGPAEYQDIAAEIITDLPPCFTVGTGIQDYRLPGCSPKITQSNVANNMKDDSSDHITYFQPPDAQVL